MKSIGVRDVDETFKVSQGHLFVGVRDVDETFKVSQGHLFVYRGPGCG